MLSTVHRVDLNNSAVQLSTIPSKSFASSYAAQTNIIIIDLGYLMNHTPLPEVRYELHLNS